MAKKIPQEILDAISRIPMFTRLTARQLSAVAAIAKIEIHPRNSFIFFESDIGDKLYFVLKGLIKIQHTTSDGRVKTLALLGRNEIFGEMAIVAPIKRSANAEVIEDVRLLVVEKQDFLALIKKDCCLCCNLLSVVCCRLEAADRQISELTFQNLPGRLSSQIFRLMEKHGQPDPSGVRVEFRVTHQDLADMVGTNRESVSKILAQFKKEGSVDIKNHHLVIMDANKLATWR